jgi:hypothetical protein
MYINVSICLYTYVYKNEWDEFVDRVTSDFFYWTEKVIVLTYVCTYTYVYVYICIYTYICNFIYIHIQGNRYQWIKPEIPVIEVEAEYGLPLTIGQDVLYWFEGGIRGELSVVSRLRIDDETSENLYDVYHKADPTRRAICIPRNLLVIPAASSEETRLLELEKQWVNQLEIARFSEERQERMRKMRLIEEEVTGLQAAMEGIYI